ncbi:helicase-exonuclease AddAB subunit AddA [Saccharibacillus kuerlensis]|uniref:ATP-dependent helicase/nuclease subunit A n=1 Tax=Saccharibacillus kuerlensis TaxID=459527 RepID=A0ABQ2L0E5_9BACL|nr:helicase-exonuclease AddAB subunit AddA [Saccharibacillus kuerlensis]GGN96824.1 ATP-dependent helicase/nuclease subunit A [Saccharibacillus kuerlensis]
MGMTYADKPAGSHWSDDQWKAIAASGGNMLVAAAAGSGKTAVLVERIIRKITDPAGGTGVDRMLIATFTKAAASEMRQRIRDALNKELAQRPQDEHLRRQLSLLGQASITTLHSFCLEVIRRHYTRIPLDPAFRIANEHESEIMRQEILEELFEEKYALEEDGRLFRRLIDWFGGERSDDPAFALVQRLYDFARSHPWPERWLQDSAAEFRVADAESMGETSWARSLLADARMALAGTENLLLRALETASLPDGPTPYVETLQGELDMLRRLRYAAQHEPWQSLYQQFESVSFGKLKSVRKDQCDPQLQQQVKDLRDAAKKELTDIREFYFGRPPETFLGELHESAELMEELSGLTIEFGKRYAKAKRTRGMVDFSDLEHYCLQILRDPSSAPGRLVPSEAALEYRERFDEVLLDEYQDTNSVQEEIVSLIAREGAGNRFMVGDVKQSIYRFRLAEPGLFLQKYRSYGSDFSQGGLRVDLARNFRSRIEVVEAVNGIFRRIMNERVAEIEYDERAELAYGALSYPEAKHAEYAPEMMLIERGGVAGISDMDELTENGLAAEAAEIETARLEARAIASRIHELTGQAHGHEPLQIYDKAAGGLRPAVYGDIVVLLRSASTWAPMMIEELRLAGIPAMGDAARGYFEATEVEIMISLLNIIDNPQQDIPLASVLRSPLIGLTEDQLAQIRLCGPRMSYYDAVCCAAQTGEESGMGVESGIKKGQSEPGTENFTGDPAAAYSAVRPGGEKQKPMIDSSLAAALNSFLSSLERWRNLARSGELSELIWTLYRETGYADWVAGLPGGTQRRANLLALYNRAVQFEKSTAAQGLFRFLRFVERLKNNGGDLSEAPSEASHDSVRLMTIHKSKGLEFPIVFIAGMSKNFNMQDLNAPFMMHKELGFGPRFVDEDSRVGYPTLPALAIRRRAHMELLAEEMRVLYVALTRPRDKMILTASVKDLTKRAAAWMQSAGGPEGIADYTLAKARSYMDWIGPALIFEPGAEKLRSLVDTGAPALITEHGNGWTFSVRSGDAESAAEREAEEELYAERIQRLKAILDGERVEDYGRRGSVANCFAWRYPHAAAGRAAAKTSVTEIKSRFAGDEYPAADALEAARRLAGLDDDEGAVETHREVAGGSTLQLRRPRFMERSRLTGAERGTAYHTLMQHIPLHHDTGEVEAAETLAQLVRKNILLQVEADTVNPTDIAGFVRSEIGRRAVSAEWLRRELPFSTSVGADEELGSLVLPVQGGASNAWPPDGAAAAAGNGSRIQLESLPGERVLVQGVVDCLFRENGRLILLDYKTDRLKPGRGTAELAAHYRFQLDFYARAVEEMLGEPVHEKWLYFFDAGEGVQL